jgi:hypothetical protein
MTEKSPASSPEVAARATTAPARQLPSQEEIAAWIEGAELPALDALFSPLALKRFDALMMQIRKEELLPQHWQVIGDRSALEDATFDNYPEVTRLQVMAGQPELGNRRQRALKIAWLELGGKQPSLWTVADLFAAMRRIIDRQQEVDFNDLLAASRDVWRGLNLPHGKEQLGVLWACLSFVRQKTKK